MTNQNKQKEKINDIQIILQNCQNQLLQIQKLLPELLAGDAGASHAATPKITSAPSVENEPFRVEKFPTSEDVIEGVFNGYQMIGGDGTPYQIPENYASKSKLVEGDLLKLTVTPQGRFIYKQIGPVERDTVRATLGYDELTDSFYAATGEREYKLLKAAVTYYKGMIGDVVVVLVPVGGAATWAAVDNVLKEDSAVKFVPELDLDPLPRSILEEI